MADVVYLCTMPDQSLGDETGCPYNTKSNDEEAQLMQVEWCESLREIKQCHEG